MSHPANRLPPQYDDIQPRDYDPAFTADISMRMNVPERIGISGYSDPLDMSSRYSTEQFSTHHMAVPDKIVVIGQDESMGVREEPRLHLDFASLPTDGSQFVNLTTPPRVLTLDEAPFPTVEEPASRQHYSLMNGYTRGPVSEYDATLVAGGDGKLSDMAALRLQVDRLSRHVRKLEDDNMARFSRERIFYPVLMGYLLLQFARWFLRSK